MTHQLKNNYIVETNFILYQVSPPNCHVIRIAHLLRLPSVGRTKSFMTVDVNERWRSFDLLDNKGFFSLIFIYSLTKHLMMNQLLCLLFFPWINNSYFVCQWCPIRNWVCLFTWIFLSVSTQINIFIHNFELFSQFCIHCQIAFVYIAYWVIIQLTIFLFYHGMAIDFILNWPYMLV